MIRRAALLILAAAALEAAEVRYRVDGSGFHVAGVSASSPVVYDNDWWYDTPDKNYLWAKASLGQANLRGNVVSRDLYDWKRGYRFKLSEQIADAEKSIAIARRAGLRNIPDPVAGADQVFERPESGRIEDTKASRSPGSDLIVAEARKASKEKPLLVLVGGPLNTVANAYLTDPSIASRMIVFMTDLRGYNGQDRWANYIVASRCKLINYGAHIWWPQRPNPPVMPPERVKSLPDNEMTRDLLRVANWFWARSTKRERPTRDDGFADGAPVFLLFDPATWRAVKRQRVTGVFTLEDVESGSYDLLDATEMDYGRMTENFFRTLADPALYRAGVDSAARNARRGPAFLDKATIYQIWLRSFTPPGTIKAAAARLPHIAKLGASVVYLSPFNVQSKVGGFSNPYRINDYYNIDPEYGTEADLKEFLAVAHQLNLKVLMDIVFYHTGPDSVMMKTPEFYMHKDGEILLGNWRLPRPDFANPKLREYLIGALLKWSRDMGVDGFRCDVSSGIPVDFWEQARAALDRVNPDLVMLAEGESPEEMLKAFDVSYAFSYQTALRQVFGAGEPATRIRQQWEKNAARFPKGTRMLRASDNHDQTRAVVEFGSRGALAASVLNFTMDGIPFLYNGQEIGDTVATDHQSHYPLRWELDMPSGQAGSGLAGRQKQMVAFYQRLFELRAHEPALTAGSVAWLNSSLPDSVVAFERRADTGNVLVIVNASNRKCEGTVEAGGRYETLLAAKGDKLEGNRFVLGAFGYVVARKEK